MSDTPVLAPHDFTPGDKPGRLQGMRFVRYLRRPAQVIAAALAFATFIIGLYIATLTTLWLFIPVILLTAALLALLLAPWGFGRSKGMVDATYADAVLLEVKSRVLRRGGRDDFESDGPQRGHNSVTGEPIASSVPANVGNVAWLRHRITRGTNETEIGVTIHHRTGRSAAWLEVLPPPQGHGDREDLERIARFQAQTAQTFGNGGLATILAHMVTVEPAGDSPIRLWDMRPPAPGTHADLAEAHQQQLDSARTSPAYRSFSGVVLDDSGEVDKAVKIKGGGDSGLATVVADELQVLADGLTEAGFGIVGAMNVSGLVSMTRHAYDHDVRVVPAGDVPPIPPAYAWPVSVHASHNYVEADGWFSSTWEVSMPYMAKPAGFDRRFLLGHQHIRRTHILLHRLTPTDVALDRYETAAELAESYQRIAENSGESHGARARRSTEAAVDRTDLLAGGDVGDSVVEYVVITARDVDTLHDHERLMRAAAASCHLTMTLLYKDQGRGITAALPFGLGIK